MYAVYVCGVCTSVVVCVCDMVYVCGVVCMVYMCMCGVYISGGGDGGVCSRSQRSLISWND